MDETSAKRDRALSVSRGSTVSVFIHVHVAIPSPADCTGSKPALGRGLVSPIP